MKSGFLAYFLASLSVALTLRKLSCRFVSEAIILKGFTNFDFISMRKINIVTTKNRQNKKHFRLYVIMQDIEFD